MAATVSAWAKPGAWALDSEEHEAELLQQQKDESAQLNDSHASDFPSLAAAATKTKKKGKTLSLQEFAGYGSAKPGQSIQSKGLSAEELLILPTGPRQRSAEELDRSGLGGAFRSYGSNGSYDRNGRDESSSFRSGSSRASDEPRRLGGFGRDSNRESLPSRADEIEDWGAAKKSTVSGRFERRENGGFFSNSESRADESESWVSNKSFVLSEGRRFGSNYAFDGLREWRCGFESNDSGADSDNWGKKKEEKGRRFGVTGGAFDSLRERRGGQESNGGSRVDSDIWLKKREEGSGFERPRLNLQPRTLPVREGQQNGSGAVAKPKGSNPFGDARPREDVLKEKGQDWKAMDEKLESMKIKETVSTDGPSFGKRSFDSSNGRATLSEDQAERSWRKTESVEVSPSSADKSGNGLAEEAADRDPQI